MSKYKIKKNDLIHAFEFKKIKQSKIVRDVKRLI